VIDGVETSREFHLRVMADPEYQAGDMSIQWLEQHLTDLLTQRPPEDETVRAAAIAAALLAEGHEARATDGGCVGWGRSGLSRVRRAAMAAPIARLARNRAARS
jgi:acetyl-CoA carboxylase, biotin carboxylase subunit